MLSFILVLLLGGFMPAGNLLASDKEQNPHYITVKNSRDLQAYFRYAPDRPIVISGHRGGMLDGYPENCIESFEKTLSYMESFFEIDPRLTKDGIIVLMHDETIDRTTTGRRRFLRGGAGAFLFSFMRVPPYLPWFSIARRISR